jgi:hypothetical protein
MDGEFNISALKTGALGSPIGEKATATTSARSSAIRELWLLEAGRHRSGRRKGRSTSRSTDHLSTGSVAHMRRARSARRSALWGTVAYQAQGLQPQRISTFAQAGVERARLQPRDAAYSYQDAGHCSRSFCSGRSPWAVYDVTSGSGISGMRTAWQRRNACVTSLGSTCSSRVGRGRKAHCRRSRDRLYEQSLDFHDGDGAVIQYIRTFPHL